MEHEAFRLPENWPAPAETGPAEHMLERFADRGKAERALAADPAVRALLASLGGNSPYLADLAYREAAAFTAMIARGPDPVADEALAAVLALPATTARPALAAALREAKRIVALVTAIADIGGLWDLARVTEVLTTLAEVTLQASVNHLLRAAHDSGEIVLPVPDEPWTRCGFTALGMGKLGASELNYSSDIDLVLLYDPAAGIWHGRGEDDAIGAFYTRLARNLVSLMEARDANGYVFRTDLRLRPDPSATPPTVALPAAIAYYESMGQNWERAAMSKARPVAGDLALGDAFLLEIRPFIWRRGVDFAAVADIHAMKRRIDAHKGGILAAGTDPVERIAGHNVKLGQGGIREIEFLAQTLQLVWGGREPDLRSPQTLGALERLAEAGRIPPIAAEELAASYTLLRRVEHRLQMVNDRQTHTLPERAPDLARFATFMGCPDATALANELIGHFTAVRRHYEAIFEYLPPPPDLVATMSTQLDFTGNDEPPEATVTALEGLGYTNTKAIVAAVRSWKSGLVRALRSERARELIEQLLPLILAALAAQPQPDLAFNRFDSFLSRLPAGVQLLSLFQRNPQLIDRLAAVFGAAPMLADHLAHHPAALDGLLSPDADPDPTKLLRVRLVDARRLEEAIAVIRRTVREEDFGISVATMEGRIDTDIGGLRRSRLADAAISALLPRVLADFATRHGHVPGGSMAVVALGKAGGREMMAGSDLDLMLIYDHPEDVTASVGAREMAAGQWFVRAAQAYVAALTARGADGPLYDIDMRLRPSGNKGPIAVSMAGFERYHAESAWTWERMSLTRARVVGGDRAMTTRLQPIIRQAIIASGEADKIRADACAMRVRMLKDLPPSGPWDVKLRPGGQIEVEFVAQVLQLVYARERPEICSTTTRLALAQLGKAGLLPPEDTTLLIRADRVWRTVQSLLRITVGRNAPEALPETSARVLIRAAALAGAPAIDLPGLRATLDGLARQVRAAFVRHVGEIA